MIEENFDELIRIFFDDCISSLFSKYSKCNPNLNHVVNEVKKLLCRCTKLIVKQIKLIECLLDKQTVLNC